MRHAWLMMIHKDPEQVRNLLSVLDDEDFDFYIHIDIKSSMTPADFEGVLTKSKLFFVDRISVTWGDFSSFEAEVNLLTAAVKGNYDYYHLISGQDYPLKSVAEIKKFFEDSEKEYGFKPEYLFFSSFASTIKVMLQRAVWKSNPKGVIQGSRIITYIKKAWVLLKWCLRYGFQNMGFGAQWFHVTHAFATDMLKNMDYLREAMRHFVVLDEIVLQFFARKFHWKKKCYLQGKSKYGYDQMMLLVDFDRGNGRNPYIYTMNDYEELMHSNKLFARKFDANVDSEILSVLHDHITKAE